MVQDLTGKGPYDSSKNDPYDTPNHNPWHKTILHTTPLSSL